MNDTYINRFIPNTNKLIHKNLSTETTMKTILSSVLCVVLMSWQITTYSQAQFGDVDCGKWIKLNRQTDKAWLLGYLSGMNTDITNKNFLNKLDSVEQAFLFVDNYCRNNPLKKVGDAAVALFAELYNPR